MSQLTLTMLGAVAKFESELIADERQRKRLHLAAGRQGTEPLGLGSSTGRKEPTGTQHGRRGRSKIAIDTTIPSIRRLHLQKNAGAGSTVHI